MNTSQIPNLDGYIVTSRQIINEIKSSSANLIFELFSANNVVHVETPDPKSINKIRQTAIEIGQKGLSKQDIEILSLALQYHLIDSENVILLTDDYSIRNIAHQLKIKSESVQTAGGNERRIYKYICRACGNTFDGAMDECEVCGSTKFERKRTR